MSLSKGSTDMQITADPRILAAIDSAIAASRWRTAARFEGRETAAQFRRLAEARSAAATAQLASFAGTAGYQPDRPHSARTATRGG